MVGAAIADITPPPWTPDSAAAFVPACGPSVSAIQQLWPGRRQYQFEEPYVDQYGTGRYAPGDLYCDANGNRRYEAPYIAGGSTAGTGLPYSVSSAGVIRPKGSVLLIDVFAGAQTLLPPPTS